MTNFDFCVCDSLMICLLWGAWFQCISIADQGGCPRRLKFFDPVNGKRLEGHVFLNLSIEKYTPCEFHCLLESRCLSANIGPSMENNKVTCELNDADHLQHPDDLKDHPGWTYRGTENACSSNPCFNKGTCTKGSSDKTFLCSCPAGYTGEQCERDIDECTRGTHKCSDGAVCNNTKGGYNCTCKPGFEGDGQNCQVYPKNCAKVYQSGNKISGVYKIDPDGLGEFEVFCDQTTAGGGWTVFQKRFDGSVDFYRGWDDYKRGFGNLTGEFWLGLDKIHRLTVSSNNKLRVDLEDSQRNKIFTEFYTFVVGNETEKYKLTLRGGSTGTAKDSLSYLNGLPFTTKDQDNDRSSTNCATQRKGAWWYNRCALSNLNGLYIPGRYSAQGMSWYSWKKNYIAMRKSQMKLRSKPF